MIVGFFGGRGMKTAEDAEEKLGGSFESAAAD
jgi:hypothetical protein